MTDLPRITLDDLNTIPQTDPTRPRHTWIPHSLVTLAQNPPAPPTIGGLLYPGKRTLLSGETESLKTWLALILAKAEIQIEQPVAWVDLDDMGAGAILQRLRALNLTDDQIHDHFLYYQPDQRLYDTKTRQKTEILADVLLQLATTGTRLMIIDAFNPILALHDLDPNSVTDVETFWAEIAAPIAKTGTAPVLLDHVVKNAESRGKYAAGSERKASGCTVHIGMHTLETLVVGGMGRAVLTTHKDRPAYLPRPTIGVLKLESEPAEIGETINYTLEADTSHTTGGFRPTVLMERISRRLELETDPVSQNWIEKNVEGKAPALRTALKVLVEGGYITPKHHSSIRPYRPDDDPILTDDSGASQVRPNRVPNLVSTGCVPASHPLRGDAGGRPTYAEGTHSSPSPKTDPPEIEFLEPEDAGPPTDSWSEL